MWINLKAIEKGNEKVSMEEWNTTHSNTALHLGMNLTPASARKGSSAATQVYTNVPDDE